MNKIQTELINVALKYLGEKEIPENKGWVNKTLQKAMELVGWRRGQHWCAYFMEMVWKEAYGMYLMHKPENNKGTIDGIHYTIMSTENLGKESKIHKLLSKLCSGNSQKTFRNFEKSGIFETGSTPALGAAVIWKYSGSAGHTAAVVTEVFADGTFKSVEGNAGNKVSLRFHKADEPNRLGFIYPKEF